MKLKSILVISTTFQLRNKMQPCKEKSYIKSLNPLKEKKKTKHIICMLTTQSLLLTG